MRCGCAANAEAVSNILRAALAYFAIVMGAGF
jgi:hypothetical protein